MQRTKQTKRTIQTKSPVPVTKKTESPKKPLTSPTRVERKVIEITDGDIDKASREYYFNSVINADKNGHPRPVYPNGAKRKFSSDPTYVFIGEPLFIAGPKRSVETFLKQYYSDQVEEFMELAYGSNTEGGDVYDDFQEVVRKRKEFTKNHPNARTKKSAELFDLSLLTKLVEEFKNKTVIKVERTTSSKEKPKSSRSSLLSRLDGLEEGKVLNVSATKANGHGVKSEKEPDMDSLRVQKVFIGGGLKAVATPGKKVHVKNFLTHLKKENDDINIDVILEEYEQNVKGKKQQKKKGSPNPKKKSKKSEKSEKSKSTRTTRTTKSKKGTKGPKNSKNSKKNVDSVISPERVSTTSTVSSSVSSPKSKTNKSAKVVKRGVKSPTLK